MVDDDAPTTRIPLPQGHEKPGRSRRRIIAYRVIGAFVGFWVVVFILAAIFPPAPDTATPQAANATSSATPAPPPVTTTPAPAPAPAPAAPARAPAPAPAAHPAPPPDVNPVDPNAPAQVLAAQGCHAYRDHASLDVERAVADRNLAHALQIISGEPVGGGTFSNTPYIVAAQAIDDAALGDAQYQKLDDDVTGLHNRIINADENKASDYTLIGLADAQLNGDCDKVIGY